jgi:hypothetical protein
MLGIKGCNTRITKGIEHSSHGQDELERDLYELQGNWDKKLLMFGQHREDIL